MNKIERPDLTGPDYMQNHHRVARQKEIEDAIISWTKVRTAEEVVETMNSAGVPVGRVVNVKDIIESEQIRARGAVQEMRVEGANGEGWNVKVPGTFPVIKGCTGQPQWAGPNLGVHTDQVLKQELGLSESNLKALREAKVIG